MVHVESLNDSKKIGVCVYNTLVMGAIGVTMAFVLPNSEVNVRFLLINGCIFLCCTTVVIIVFGSKIFTIIKHGPSKVDDLNNTLPGNGSTMNQNQTSTT
uniref:G_PROTEIN_RECEP_F3_4 domain-containing protein n=1 Tax=Macrostomum lignano TaxID=282301 RepID=A0A1I8G1D4_9PLAT